MSASEVKQLETPGTHIEVWYQPEDTATISVSVCGAPLDYAWLQKAIEEVAEQAKAQGKKFARIFINHVAL